MQNMSWLTDFVATIIVSTQMIFGIGNFATMPQINIPPLERVASSTEGRSFSVQPTGNPLTISISFSPAASSTADEYLVDFGDENLSEVHTPFCLWQIVGISCSRGSLRVSHTYERSGSYTVRLLREEEVLATEKVGIYLPD